MHQLARMAREKAEATPYMELLTPADDRMYGSLMTFQIKGKTDEQLKPVGDIFQKNKVWTLWGQRVRLSTHIHTRPSDVDLFFNTVREVLG
jgi:selenocysteine lyase/cysteine desulfurase